MIRGLTGILWLVLLVYLWKPFRRVVKADGSASSSDLIMSAVWLLCLNRETFTLVGQFMPGDEAALSLCYGFALFAGLYMLFMCSLARRRD
jgi:hypothetical protein